MSNSIHPSAVIHPSAELGEDVHIGPFAVVGPGVKIGDRTRLLPHAHIVTRTTLGTDCVVCSSAVIGGDPQDLKFRGEDTDLIIGNHTRIGEFVTLNRGTGVGGGVTRVGDGCMIMAYVHVAHDCIIGDGVVITNLTQLAGHIHIEDFAWLSGSCMVHHFVTIGTMSFIAPGSGLGFDAPPYSMVEGFRDECRVRTLNTEGLIRRHVPKESQSALRKAFKFIYRNKEGLTQREALNALVGDEVEKDLYAANFLKHLRDSGESAEGRALERFRDKTRCIPKSGETEVVG